ncbi:hypothetical protein KPH14_006715 [Odynerus spinipes]|uniref:Uncharacterized protein n=1 Tax=Odynerus spinipes TaxID=1348599 RepID=A0AAD9RR52_9HYME|nr:hypothetical protein KPH14_006715 [Odynerus spinipes]
MENEMHRYAASNGEVPLEYSNVNRALTMKGGYVDRVAKSAFVALSTHQQWRYRSRDLAEEAMPIRSWISRTNEENDLGACDTACSTACHLAGSLLDAKISPGHYSGSKPLK